jgi:stage II sporulation protein GA (sporulation sigma-E factor processing peptidase)
LNRVNIYYSSKGGIPLYVYAEYLLIENAIINYIILYVTKRFTRTETSKFRLIVASIIGALYTFVVFFPSLNFMTKFSVKVSISILIIILAFNPEKFKKFIRLFITFYIVNFVFAGATLAIFYFFDSNVIFYNGAFYLKDFPYQLLVLGIIVSFVLVKYAYSYFVLKINKNDVLINVTINLNNKNANIVALVDTGNSLKEPISQRPVMIVEFLAIKDILPVKIQEIYIERKELNLDLVSKVMSEINNEMQLRLIPFKSIGRENGILLGFKPDEIIINNENIENKSTKEIIVGIYNSKLSGNEKYRGLLNPEILI